MIPPLAAERRRFYRLSLPLDCSEQRRKGLFLFIKRLAPLQFSRQPNRQKFGFLISLGNFER
jgi:hypothetical protein